MLQPGFAQVVISARARATPPHKALVKEENFVLLDQHIPKIALLVLSVDL